MTAAMPHVISELARATWPESIDATRTDVYARLNTPDGLAIVRIPVDPGSAGAATRVASDGRVRQGPACGSAAAAYLSTDDEVVLIASGQTPERAAAPGWLRRWLPPPVWTADDGALVGLAREPGRGTRLCAWSPSRDRVLVDRLDDVAPVHARLACHGDRVYVALATPRRPEVLVTDITGEHRDVVFRGDATRYPQGIAVEPSTGRLAVLAHTRDGSSLLVGSSHEAALPATVGPPRWLGPDRVVVLLDDYPRIRPAIVDVAAAVARPVPLPAGVGLVSTLSTCGDAVAALVAGPRLPPAVMRIDLDETAELIYESADAPHDVGFVSGRIPLAGYALPYLWYPSPAATPRGTVVMLHGGPAAAWRAGWSPLVHTLLEMGANVCLLETRGSTATVAGRRIPAAPEPGVSEVADVRDAIAYLRREYDLGRSLALHGHSYGGFLAIRAGAELDGLDLVIATSGFFGTGDLGASPDPSVAAFRRSIPDLPARTQSLRCPLLVVHGERDMQVPIGGVREAFAAVRAPRKVFLALPDEGHAISLRRNVVTWFSAAVELMEELFA